MRRGNNVPASWVLSRIIKDVPGTMSMIVRKRAYAALSRGARANPYARRARMAYRLGSYAYKNRRTIGRVASYAYRATKRRKANNFSRRNIGEPVGTGTTKRSATDSADNVLRNTRQQYVHSLSDIPEGTELDARQRRIVNLRGFKLCLEVKSIGPAPLYVNIAVLSPKGNAENVTVNDFFRSSQATDRARDFADDLNSNEFHCLPINADRYTILKHKRYRLIPGGTESGSVSQQGLSYMNVDWYIPLKRQLRYDGTTGQPEAGAVSLVYWFDEFATSSGTASTTGIVQMSRRCVTYFKEPKN